jgi:hypothetical protein
LAGWICSQGNVRLRRLDYWTEAFQDTTARHRLYNVQEALLQALGLSS